VETLIDSIRKKAFVHRIRIKEFLVDFDKLRAGHISRAEFRRSLNQAGFKFNDGDFTLLADTFAFPPSLAFPQDVRYLDFVNCIDEVCTVSNLEKAPMTIVSQMARPEKGSLIGFTVPLTTKIPPKPTLGDKAPQALAVLEGVMNRFRDQAFERRLLLKSFFQDFDRHNVGRVTQQQFLRVLKTISLNCSEEEAAAIIAEYAVTNAGDVDYVRFGSDVVPHTIQEGFLGSPTYRPPDKHSFKNEFVGSWDSTKNPNPPPFADFTASMKADLESVLIRIRNVVAEQRVRLKDFFLDHDKGLQYGPVLRKGVVPLPKFLSALSMAVKYELPKDELQLLIGRFQHPEDPQMIDYIAFAHAINQPFDEELVNLQASPLKDTLAWQPIHMDSTLTREDSEKVNSLLGRIRENIRVRRVCIKPFFTDFDASYMSTPSLKSRSHGAHTTNLGRINRSQFRRAVTQYGLCLSLEEYELLEKRFGVPEYPEQVDYRKFCEQADSEVGMLKTTDAGRKILANMMAA